MALFSGTVLIVGVPFVLFVIGLSIYLRSVKGTSKAPKPKKLHTVSIEKWEIVDDGSYKRLRLYAHCLLCQSDWRKRVSQEGHGHEELLCPRCGAGGTIDEVQALMRAEKEVELQIAQTEKRIADLKRLSDLKKEEKMLEEGKTRIVEA